MMKSARDSRAFSLIEVALALGIVTIGLIGVLSIFPAALRTARDNHSETRSVLLAQTIFAELYVSQQTVAGFTWSATSVTNSWTQDLLAAEEGAFFTSTLTTVPVAGETGTAWEADLMITWPGGSNSFTVLLPEL